MTDEEIRNMPAGREMDQQIADAFNLWHAHPEYGDSYRDKFPHYCSRYSTDIAAAFEMEQKVYEVDSNAVEYISRLSEIVLNDAKTNVCGDWYFLYLMVHASAEQRCRAALLATAE